MISRTWQGPTLRDVLVSSLRRAPSSHPNNSDSLRRAVLHRNTVTTTPNDPELSSPKLVHRPWHLYDAPIAMSVDDYNSVKRSRSRSRSDRFESAKAALGSPTPSQVVHADPTAHPEYTEPTQHIPHDIAAQREQAWFDQIMDDLDWANSLGEDPDGSQLVTSSVSSDSPQRLLRRNKRQYTHSHRLSLLPTIPE
ncbi:hypothetical protein MPSI1_003825 [Malassezia psittaci]|uniref:Uncharacterized protein n=1 Tax=Malassezia psittaci TaxID=1821823 RepID=A0AAF0JFX5_9BASI|nr:hypothetical protein MPSI1_003825 [Malassezia psittaci]